MKTLYESILDNIDLNKNPYKEMFPIPSSRDFKKTKWGDTQIFWYCKGIIQAYINTFDARPAHKKSEFDSIVVRIDGDKYIQTAISIGENGDMYELTGVGDWVSNSLPETKKETLKFFKYLQENPEGIKKLFDYANDAKTKMVSTGVIDCKAWNKILGY